MTALKRIFHATLFLSVATHALPSNASDEKPNGGKAEAVGQAVGGAAGAAVGTLTGAMRGGQAGAAAGERVGEAVGARLGGSAGQYLDERAAENAKTGRGGPDDPRYDPSSLFQ
jgi:hypothetical protein